MLNRVKFGEKLRNMSAKLVNNSIKIRKFGLVTTKFLCILLITTFITSVCSTASVQQQQIQGRENNTTIRAKAAAAA